MNDYAPCAVFVEMGVPSSVCVVAVTKGRSFYEVEDLLKKGHRLFGENKIQEIERKWPVLLQTYPEAQLQFIGRLQRNKVDVALSFCHSIASIDRLSLVEKIAQKQESMPHTSIRTKEFLIQVKFGNELQKGGVSPGGLKALLDACREAKNIPIHGLMTIPPAHRDPRPFFKELRALCDLYKLSVCSMGMSDDYKIAIEEGATHVRLGRCLFERTD